MKKSLLALAVLGTFAGVASAQSSVTLYGTIDLSGKYVKNDGSARRYSLSQDGINSSQLGFRGIEDLGGGLKAGFTLLSGLSVDTGRTSGDTVGKFFNRRATVSLLGGFGEVRLGRDYTPTFWNNTIFDAFGTNGVGDSSHVLQLSTTTFVRADNSIGYFLPSAMGGLYGQFMAAASEGGPVTNAINTGALTNTGANANPGRYLGARIGFAAGPFDIAGAYGQQRFQSGVADLKTYNIGGSFDFGFFKLLAFAVRDTQGSNKETRGSVSGVLPLGQGEIHLGYDRSKLTTATFNNSVNQIKAGYVYNLSKRTALYTTVAQVDNDNRSRLSVTSGSSQTAAPTLGGKSLGGEVGVRHFF